MPCQPEESSVAPGYSSVSSFRAVSPSDESLHMPHQLEKSSEEYLPSADVLDSPVAPEYSPLSVSSGSGPSEHVAHVLDNPEIVDSLPSSADEDCPSVKVVGDNLDKYIRPREMRADSQATTHHYFNMYAFPDRVNTCNLDDQPSLPDPSSINLEKLFLTPEEEKKMYENFQILIARVLVKHMPFFKSIESALPRHIEHEHSVEMAKKSEVVSM